MVHNVSMRFGGTSLINSGVLRKMDASLIPDTFRQLPGYISWSSSGVAYDTGLTFKADKGVVLNEDDDKIRAFAQTLADRYYGGDLKSVLYQTPVSLTEEDRELVYSGLRSRYGWTV